MTETETNEQTAMTVEMDEEATLKEIPADLNDTIAQMEGTLTVLSKMVAKVSQDMEAVRTSFGKERETGAPLAGGESGALAEMREATASVRTATENMPLEVSRAVVAELSAAVAGLTKGTDVKLQEFSDTAKSLHASAVAIERDILEARAIHEAHLEVRERWALIVMLISLWFSVVISLCFGYLWFR
jgi:DNA gyrase/topoisomerase IV subunit A